MTCILGANFALAVEGYSIDELGIVWKEDSYRILDDLLRTWITCEFDEIPGLVAMRYLGGILRLPSFWREENRNNHHQEFARKLFKRIRRFLEDVGFGREGPLGFTEHVSDIEGIDVVTLSALEGVNMWSQNCIGELNSECWVEEFRKAIDLLLTPEATTHLPHSSKLAIALFSEVDPKSSLANNPKSESAHVHQKNEMGEAEEIEAASLNTPEKMVNALPRIGVPSSRSPSDNDPKLESIHDHTDMHTDRHTDTLQLHTDDGLKIGREFTVDGTMNQQLLMPWKVAAVRSKTSGGWKAVKDIPAGCLILMEAPWLVLPSDYTSTQLSLALKSLNSDLAAFRQLPAPQVGYDRDITIFVFNAVKFTTNVGVFNVASRLSRSYRPNLFKYWNDDHQLLEYRACCDILAGEELLGPPFSSLTLLQPQKERCLLSSTWHTIQERSQCSYCDRTIDSTADMRRAALAGILLKNALSPRPHLRIHRLHEAIKWLEEENLSYFQADVCYMLHQAYESIQDLENSMLHLTKALDWSKTTIGEGDMRVKNLVQAIADLQMQMVD
ncbi:hypothetical protein FRC17_005357 [Serendipita sp. 399]|nr:hypothetical protein FRC17_005357 [Serendipita sp. 399]